MFEKLIRLPEAVVEKHVDASQGQLRVLQGRRCRVRVAVLPPPRPLLLRAGHGRTRPGAGRGEVREAAAAARAPRALSDLPGAEHSSQQGAGRDAKAEPPPGCGAGNVGARPPPPAARDYSAAGSRPPQPFRVSAPASIQASGAASASCSPSGPGTRPRGPQASARLRTPTRGPNAQPSEIGWTSDALGRAGELDSGSENSWSAATERGWALRCLWLGPRVSEPLGVQCQSPPTSSGSQPAPSPRPKAANPQAVGRRGRGLQNPDHLLGPTTNIRNT